MKKEILEATKRDAFGKTNAKKIRNEGLTPGVVYGGQNEPVSIIFDSRKLNRIYKGDFGKNVPIQIKIDDNGKQTEVDVITKKIDRDVIQRTIKHVDFFILEEKKAIVAEVPINIVGTSPGVKKGGVFILKGRMIQVKLLPSKLIPVVDVDISALEIGEDIKYKDINLGDDVEILSHSLKTIVRCAPPKTQLEEDAEMAAVEDSAEGDTAEGSESPEAGASSEGDDKKENS